MTGKVLRICVREWPRAETAFKRRTGAQAHNYTIDHEDGWRCVSRIRGVHVSLMSLSVCRLVGVEPVVGVDGPAAAVAAAVVHDVPALEVAPGDHDNDDHSVGWADDLVPGDANPHDLVVPFAAAAAHSEMHSPIAAAGGPRQPS